MKRLRRSFSVFPKPGLGIGSQNKSQVSVSVLVTVSKTFVPQTETKVKKKKKLLIKMTSEAVNGETSEAFIEEDWSNLLTWPLSRRRSSNESHHLLLNGNLYTP